MTNKLSLFGLGYSADFIYLFIYFSQQTFVLKASQYFKDFSSKIGDGINECDFFYIMS